MYRVRVEAVVIGALYLPSRPQYGVESLVDYTEACVEEVVRSFPQALVILAGDFNQLSSLKPIQKYGAENIGQMYVNLSRNVVN